MRIWERLRRAVIGTPPTPAARTTSPEQIKEPSGDETSYSADQPIKSQGEDRFNRWPFAERVADTLARRPSSAGLVVAICGIWGDGKTSTLNLLEQALKKYEDVVIVRFNPWLFESQAKLLEGFFATLADALGRALPTKIQELGRILNRYGAILSVASVGLATAARELGKSLSVAELEDLKRRLEGFLREENKKVVVLIDDIDRLDQQEIHAMFKLVKLSAGFECTSYVLAFDDDVVAAALGKQYAEGGKEAGRNFLEKIVQVSLHLPPVDQLTLRQFAFKGAETALRLAEIQLSEEQVQAFGQPFVDALELRLMTPRQAKRYANALFFALPILKGEVNPVDQMLIEGIRVFLPALYVAIRKSPDVFLCEGRDLARNEGFRKRASGIIDDSMKNLSQPDRERVRQRLLEGLFPRLKGVFGGVVYGSDAEERWDREQRICSRNYFDRYFQYSVPPGDVSDLVVEKLLEVASSDAVGAAKIFQDISERGGMRCLIEKLRRVEDKVERLAAERVALLIAWNAGSVPRENVMFLSDWSFTQAAVLVMKLLWRIPGGSEREDLARRLVREAEPLIFGAECYRRFRRDDRDLESPRLLPAGIEEDLGRIVAERVKASAAEDPPYRRFPDDAPLLLWIWDKYGVKGEVRDYLHGRFESVPEEIDDFLSAFVPKAWGMESGLSYRSDFRRDAYDTIGKLIEPEFLFEKLRTRYGEELDNPVYHQNSDVALGKRFANQFAFIHLGIKEELRKGTKGEGDAKPQ